jgi:hypothetical protein
MKHVVEGIVNIERVEDGSQALICEAFPIETGHSDEENGMSIQLSSWDEDKLHTDLNLLSGKKIRITIEVI